MTIVEVQKAVLTKMGVRYGHTEPEFYGYLVCRFKKIIGTNGLYDQFRKTVMCYEKMDI